MGDLRDSPRFERVANNALDGLEVFVELLLGYWLLIVIILAVAAFFIFQPLDRYRCSSYAQITEQTTRYVFMDGCYVDTQEGWRHRDQFRVMD